MKTEKETEKSEQIEWKGIVHNFVTNMLSIASDNISLKIQLWVKAMKKRGTGVFFMMTGVVFVMVGLSMYINSVFSNISPWIGYVSVGFVACVGGSILSKK